MNNGIYSVLSGSIAQERRLEIITNNIANINTPGYKREEPIFQRYIPKSFENISPVSNKDKVYVEVVRTMTQFSPGGIKDTGNPLDLAIEGNGFFVVETDNGTRYTRSGNFTLDSERRLVTQDGSVVLGEGGPILLEEGKISVDADGKISVNNNEVGALLITDFPDMNVLQKDSNTFFKGEGGVPSENFKVIQGKIELSNVEPMSELSSMIEVIRSYQAYQKVIQTISDTTSRSINEVGKI
ncbi:MAG: flagellar basal-body rod protein FlgF [Nitrospirota bacterium]